MKKIILPGIVVLTLVFSLFSLSPSVTSAKTSSKSTNVAQLEKQIKSLMAEIESLKAQMKEKGGEYKSLLTPAPVDPNGDLNTSKKLGKPITLLEDLNNSKKLSEPEILIGPKVNDSKEPLILLSPNNGETLKAGEIYKIQWKGGNANAKLKLSVYGEKAVNGRYGSSRYTVIAKNVENTGSYVWKVPSSIAEGRYYVWVEWPSTASQRHAMSAAVMDRSDMQIVISKGSSEDFLRSDINSDGKVNDTDMRLLENSRGVCPANTGAYFTSFNFCSADINVDGIVDDADQKILENNRS